MRELNSILDCSLVTGKKACRLLVLAGLAAVCAVPVLAENYPSYLLQMGQPGSAHALLVDKQAQTLSLFRSSAEGPSLVKKYRCTTGRNNNGTKVRAGDEKTPNGIYFFQNVREDGQLPDKYGVRAFIMNYPNDYDRLNHKTGSGIWLHAVDDNHRVNNSFDTEGCVVVTNDDILDLSNYIVLRNTPIIIDDSISTMSDREIDSIRREVLGFIDKWAGAWQNKDIDRYIECYHQGFSNQGRNLAQYKKYKDSLNKAYSFIRLALSDVKIFRYEDYLVVDFFQDYRSSGLTSLGRKTVYLFHAGDDLKIFSERFQRQ